MRYLSAVCLFVLAGCGGTGDGGDHLAASERENVTFEIEHMLNDEALAVYVLGDLPELGGDDLTQALKLISKDRSSWRVTVSLPIGRAYTYRFYTRDWRTPLDSANGEPIGDAVTAETMQVPVRPAAKVVYVHSSFDPPVLHWRQGGGSFSSVTMEQVGAGRGSGEKRWVAGPFGESQRAVELYLTNMDESERDPSGTETYETPLETFFLQDAHLFTYVPAATVSAPTRDYEVLSDGLSSTKIASAILGDDYEFRVFLPRGYDEHTTRRYPVLYLQDGTVAWDDFFPVAPSDLDGAITADLIRLGRVGELIMVGIDSTVLELCGWSERRARDYLPPGSVGTPADCALVGGEADAFVAFVIDELKPLIDAQYRTLPDAAHTFDAGFSFGAIAAFYMGWGFDETFSRVGVQSVGTDGTFPYFSQIVDDPKPSTRFYFDSAGAGEPVVFAQALSYRDDLLSREQGPFVLERDLRYFAGELEGHVRAAAGSRLPEMLSFLYPASEETPECYDGVDNDGDGSIDYVPGARDNDPDCTSALDPSEEE